MRYCRITLTILCFLLIPKFAHSAVTYEVLFDQSTYVGNPGDTLVANLLLRETATEGDPNLIAPGNGLGSANFRVAWTGTTDLISSLGGPGFISGGIDVEADHVVVRQLAFPPGDAGVEVSQGVREVTIGTFEFQVPTMLGAEAVITPSDQSLGSDFAIAATPTTILDGDLTFRSSTISAVPEPTLLPLLGMAIAGVWNFRRPRRDRS
ncbi:PEP-CTERM sorting domain-containing protein [Roseiconus lacunae]|uniref:PEP-CTERM sorting domain-containing protein n=1 Tax=Roseiconus lacunae TaxID=2605694 RepID=UPI001359C2C6|nr:PEP-CTERM sorting domain-containing protein [Roseiconus lacunae]